MGEILGLGITHQPALVARDVKPLSLRTTIQDPGLPDELRAPAGWPAAMRAEWSDDEGAAFGVQHRAAILAELRQARAALDAFQPDFLLRHFRRVPFQFHERPPDCILRDCQEKTRDTSCVFQAQCAAPPRRRQ